MSQEFHVKVHLSQCLLVMLSFVFHKNNINQEVVVTIHNEKVN